MNSPLEIDDITAIGSLRGSRPTDVLPGDDKKWRARLPTGRRGLNAALTVTLPKKDLVKFPVVDTLLFIGTVSEAEITLIGKYELDDTTTATFTATVSTEAPVIVSTLKNNGQSAPTYIEKIIIKPLKSTTGRESIEMDLEIIACVETGENAHFNSMPHYRKIHIL